ncbi:MAG: SUMF1/EgtB/PvdO family nonheme iron enzyme [Chromatiales bacterium]|nr:SUMF1/EgtB/PvdO family nonheme iron enzyme [Chromatiales bacterium]
MSTHNLLGQLSGLHDMMTQLVESQTEADCYQSFHPDLAPLAWYFGYAMYRETLWVREIIQGDSDMTERVRAIFHVPEPGDEQWRKLPPKDHLLNWALELQDENLTRLANPAMLPDHPLIQEQRLLPIIVQELARIYEQMLVVVNQRQLRQIELYTVQTPLTGQTPGVDYTGASQGHYRIGAKGDSAAFDNELPTQIVDLSSFNIDRHPTSNSHYLAFMEAGGYEDKTLWSEQGWAWQTERPKRPHYWRKDSAGHWYAIGLNGPFDLIADEPVVGVSYYEAGAYANWVSNLSEEQKGAVLQHEYQWEAAIRTKVIQNFGRVWEWCSNPFKPYTGYIHSPYQQERTGDFSDDRFCLRGASMHTQRSLRRISLRNRAAPSQNYLFAGIRLVYPPTETEE